MSGKFKLSIQLRDRHLQSDSPVVMGILNVTPDSFSDGGYYNTVDDALKQIEKMLRDGAEIIDIGGESTRPGSDPVNEEEELLRVIPVIEKAIHKFPEAFYSIDTTKYRVAHEALERGVHIINDVSGLRKEPRFINLSSETGAGYILMHSIGNPKTMQVNPEYAELFSEMDQYFSEAISKLQSGGVENIIIDPGIGFGKKLDHNVQIIRNLNRFKKFDCPVMMGASRKSMIGQILNNRPAERRLAGTIALHYQSLINGAALLRVHDIEEAMDSIRIFSELND